MACSAGRSRSYQTPIWILAVIVLAPSIRSAWGDAPIPDPASCAGTIVGSIDDIVNAAYDINQAALDCTLPDLDELSCAADLTDMMSYWFNLGNKVATLTLVCGQLDNGCAADVLQAFGDISDTSNALVAAAQDCVSDSWFCAFDVVSAVDDLNSFVKDIISALQSCNAGDLEPVNFGGFDADFEEFPVFSRPGDGGYFVERRLGEVLGGSAGFDNVADGELESVVSGAAPVVQMRQDAQMAEKQFDIMHSRPQADMQRLREVIEKQKVSIVGAEMDTAEDKTAALESLVMKARSQRTGSITGSPVGVGDGKLMDATQKFAAAAAATSAAAARMSERRLQKITDDIHI
eukprot:CAMPEP_0115658790 /NCGR_PEP_ID=MMETSP0272-20121206/45389_1 /TAXON_ID=71861 /ORGANISM="Scrippsiella trochoidea, Strain CCMP3099" /LENGTH=347 /DNA_ID=CAMNT_0003096883 /DNA_START=46 /DNA_END=1089 /DNA_ORIENTATION=-